MIKKYLLLFIALIFLKAQAVSAANFPEPHTTEGFGVNVHSGSYTVKDFQMMQQAGFKFFRADVNWHEIEKSKGNYDFSTFDTVLPEASKLGFRPLLILDYGNPVYGCTYNVKSDACMAGFKNFVREIVTRYKNYNVIWEVWNEPDCGYFWKPQPAFDDYMNLVKEIVPVIRNADPDSTVIAPAVGNLNHPYTFLKKCFKLGLLDYVDAVSVHPYRDPSPETVIDDYENLRQLIKQYSPEKPDIPIIAGEWGASSAENGRSLESQAKYILREYLINLYQGIPVTIWYKWKNDGANPLLKDDNWGLVTKADSTKKPALIAFENMTGILKNLKFIKRIEFSDPEVFALLFKENGTDKNAIIAWSSGAEKQLEFGDGKIIKLTDTPDYMLINSEPKLITQDNNQNNKKPIENNKNEQQPQNLLENIYYFVISLLNI